MDASQPKTILVTGGTGFAGRHLIELLDKTFDCQIVATGFSHTAPKNISFSEKVRYMSLDLTNHSAVFELIKAIQPNWIFHLAAISIVGASFERAAEVFHNNLTLQLNVLEAVREHSPQARVLVIGSGTEYGIKTASQSEGIAFSEEDPLQPLSPYAVSKVTQDLLGLAYANSYGLDIVRVRPFNHIGLGQTADFAIPAFASQIVAVERGEQKEVKVGNLEPIRDLSDVRDVVKAYVLLMEKGVRGEVYNVGSGQGYTMRSLLDKMIAHAKVSIDVKTDESRLRPDTSPLVSNSDKIKKLGWKPEIPLEESLKLVLEEWRGKA